MFELNHGTLNKVWNKIVPIYFSSLVNDLRKRLIRRENFGFEHFYLWKKCRFSNSECKDLGSIGFFKFLIVNVILNLTFNFVNVKTCVSNLGRFKTLCFSKKVQKFVIFQLNKVQTLEITV